MGYNVVRTDEFETSYDQTLHYLCDILETPRAAANLMHELEKVASVLATTPYVRSVSPKPFLAKHSLREYFLKRYIVIYRVSEGTVTLVNLFHQTQDYEAERHWT